MTGQSKAKFTLHHKPAKCLECRNSKSNTLLNVDMLAFTQFMNLKLEEFICIVHLYLHAKFLGKSEIWPKIWFEGPQTTKYTHKAVYKQ